METAKNQKEMEVPTNKKKPKDDIINVVKQFISYFEEVDRGEKNDNSFSNS